MSFELGRVSTAVIKVQTVTSVQRLAVVASTGLQPQRFVRTATAWPVVEPAAFDVAQVVDLARRRDELGAVPLEKLWAEAIYEAVRSRVLPDAPSRLDCLYAVEMGYDAFSILPELGQAHVTFDSEGWPTSGPAILAARTRGRWVPVDMHLFQAPASIAADEKAVAVELDTLQRLAEHYWKGDASPTPIAELLCDGLDHGAA